MKEGEDVTNLVSTGVKLIPNSVTRVEENLKKTFGKRICQIFSRHCNLVNFRTRLHVGIVPTEQISRDLHQRLSDLFLLEYAGPTEHILTGSLVDNEKHGEPIMTRNEEHFSDEGLIDGEWKTIYHSKKRSIVWVENQEEMCYEGTPVKAPPASRRRMMPPTPQQSSYSSIEAMQWQTDLEDQGSGWNARDRTVIAKMEQYLNDSDCIKLEIEELELPLGPEDSELNLRHILRNVSRRSGRIFKIFSSKEESEH